jgi:hypothetical protein
MAAALRDVEAATLALDGSPPITRTTFPTCRAHYPGGSSGCACRLLPRSYCLPQMAGGSASALSLSRPAQASLTLRPTGLLSHLTRPLSRGSSPAGYPAEPLVSYQINRQLSGWNLPPLVIRAFGAHCQTRTWRDVNRTKKKPPEDGSPIQNLMIVDQAAINAGFNFRR